MRANLIPESYMSSQDIIDLRNLCRFRASIGSERTRALNRIRGLLARLGYTSDFKNPTCARARIWLRKLPFSEHERLELDFLLATLDRVTEQRDALQEQIKAEAAKRPACRLISSISGFADYSSLLILAEIGDIKRFETAEQLVSFAGLVPSTYQSGETLR